MVSPVYWYPLACQACITRNVAAVAVRTAIRSAVVAEGLLAPQKFESGVMPDGLLAGSWAWLAAIALQNFPATPFCG